MALPLPNLDDRRWIELVEEARALIPSYAPQWTDHNIHDPGITLIELFAAIAEMDVYQLNRIAERHRRKFLALVGVEPRGPQAARTVVRCTLAGSHTPVALPAELEVEGTDAFGTRTRFRTLVPISVVGGELVAVQRHDDHGFHDLTARWQRGEPIAAFGDDPHPGDTLYLGFTRALPPGVPVSLAVATLPAYSSDEQWRRLVQERDAHTEECRPSPTLVHCTPGWPCAWPDDTPAPESEPPPSTALPHHAARLAWAVLVSGGRWQTLDPARGDVDDETRSLTLNGTVRITAPRHGEHAVIGTVTRSLYYLRIRFVAGAYDAAPELASLTLNGVPADQTAHVTTHLPLTADVVIAGTPALGSEIGLALEVRQGAIHRVELGADVPGPRFRLIELAPHAAVLGVDAAFLGVSDGRPCQQFALPQAPAVVDGFTLLTFEDDTWTVWARRPDFDASGRTDRHFMLDATNGIVHLGDGELGHVPPAGALLLARYLSTRAEAGGLDRGRITGVAETTWNHALVAADVAALVHVSNPVPAVDGAAAETVAHAEGRAAQSVGAQQRAVTLADCEALARQTPGVRLARVEARANLYPGLPCVSAPGVITVLVLPYLPLARPTPTPALLRAVAAYLRRRRIVGTRIEVAGPVYVEVFVRAQVQAYARSDRGDVRQRVVAALDRFFHPLRGGPDGSGWPFGRDVYRSEVLQVLDETPGVDHVVTLELIAGGGAQCGNLCIGPMGLVAAGTHEIEVL